MKKTLLTFGLAAMLFASCATDPDGLNTIVPQGTPQINISGDIDQQYATRVDENGFCDGDQVGLYGVNYTNDNTVAGTLMDEGNQVNNALYTYSTENGTFTSSGSFYYKDAQTNIDLYAYYPFAHPETVIAYEFEVALDQNQGTGHAMSDFLWAKATNVTPSENKVGLRFSHRLSLANVILKEGTGFANGEFDNLSKSVLALNTTRTATIDLSTGIATAVGEPENEGIIMKATDNGFRAIVVPQSIVGATPLFAITIDGITYRFKRDDATAYLAGKMAKFTITINRKAHTGTYELVLTDSTIEDWEADIDTYGGEARQYFVVHLDEAGTLEAKIAEAKKNPAKIKNLKVSGKICAGDFDFMRDKMVILQAVNLKEAKVVGCWTYAITYEGESSATTEYFEGALPSTTAERKEIANARAAKLGKKIKSYGNAKVKSSVADNIPGGAFKDKTTLAYFAFPEYITSIANSAFKGCSLLMGALVIPDSVTEIGESAFSDCTSLTSLDLPVRVEKIYSSAFSGCSSLTGPLPLPSTLKSIGGSAFSGCGGFTGNLVLPEGLETLGAYAFSGCSGFTGDLRIPESITILYGHTFESCYGMKGQLILHDGLSFAEEGYQFYNCSFQGELKLPAYITSLPVCCFCSCDFTTLAPLPKELTEISDGVFQNCYRLMGTIELPESVIAIRDNAFRNCYQLEGIVIPSDVGIIMDNAFENCYGLTKFICRATEPPILQSNVFKGVAKDNFTLEVPEESINKYQADTKWREFKRIAAHHDFTISRSKMRVLSAEHSRTFILRAPSGQSWSIESKPEWVTITPSSGVGKTEVTITVNQMTAAEVGQFQIKIPVEGSSSTTTETHKGRAGEVVFLLDGKDYRTNLKIEQYDYQYSDGDVLIVQKATAVDPNKGVNLVFMGDCFDARDIAKGTYLSGTNQAIDHFFAVEPYKTYRDYFNVYTIFGMSNDSGMGTVDTIRDAKFGSQYTLNEGISPNINTIIDYALKTESVTEQNFNKSLVVMVENSKEYGGLTYMYGDGSAIAICPMSADAYPYDFRGIVQHEACGHGFAKLADEYIYHNAFIQSCNCLCCDHTISDLKELGWYRNIETTGDMNEVGWSHLIFNPKYSDIVDIYEGGYYHTRGVYRSEPVSCMNNNIPYFSAISRQEAVERIMRYSGQTFNIDDFYANDVLDIQGNNTGKASVLDAAPTAITLTGAGKQMPPKYMGNSPFDK